MLALVSQAYDGQDYPLDDVGVLSIREPGRLYLLSEVSDRSAAASSIVDGLEKAVLGTALPPAPLEDRPQP